jgi:signal transduction histidine kinase
MKSRTYPSFRKRLLIRVGVFVGPALFLFVGIVWLGALVWLRVDAKRFVQLEAEEITSFILGAGDVVEVDNYPWNEPHHLFVEVRVDPLFVQIFDINKQEVFATANIEHFPEGAFTRRMDGALLEKPSPFFVVKTRFLGSSELYFNVFPLKASDDTVLGYIQIARFIPDIHQSVRMLGIGALLSTAVLLLGLLGLIYLNAGRLLMPLQTMARTADSLSADQLDLRIPYLKNADQESVSLALAFNRLLERLEASFEEMTRFNSNASHQLQTPLTVLKGHIDVTLRKERTIDEYKKTLQLASEETESMAGIVRSLMQLSRLESNPSSIPKEPVCLSDLCEEICNRYTSRIGRIESHVDPNIWILSQSDICGQFIGIFLDNAIKYDRGGVVLVQLNREAVGRSSGPPGKTKEAVLVIHDHGTGIEADELKFVRERFFRGRSAQDQRISGEGLGLALADQIATWQGARWEIQSSLKNGTVVTCHFPLLTT